ncbi:MAG: hypothetical protein JWM11_933 [Planctomycetaceae bacterium]|nr:hypothetical protein [Planctomycetaceae bacterium]
MRSNLKVQRSVKWSLVAAMIVGIICSSEAGAQTVVGHRPSMGMIRAYQNMQANQAKQNAAMEKAYMEYAKKEQEAYIKRQIELKAEVARRHERQAAEKLARSEKNKQHNAEMAAKGLVKPSTGKTPAADKAVADKVEADKTEADKTISTDKVTADKKTKEKGTADKTVADKTTTDKTTTDKAVTSKTSPPKTSTEKTATDKTQTEKATTDKTSDKKPVKAEVNKSTASKK